MLYDAHVRLTRTMLKTPHWNKTLVPYVPDAARSFFETFRDKTFEQRKNDFLALRNTNREYIVELESKRGQPDPLTSVPQG